MKHISTEVQDTISKMTDDIEQLRNSACIRHTPKHNKRGGRWRTKLGPDGTELLGDTIKQLMEYQILPRQARFEAIAKLWSELLPVELYRHCRLADISGGQLEVLVDSASHLYELQLCSSELLGELQQQCPQARIKKIRFAVG